MTAVWTLRDKQIQPLDPLLLPPPPGMSTSAGFIPPLLFTMLRIPVFRGAAVYQTKPVCKPSGPEGARPDGHGHHTQGRWMGAQPEGC